MPPREEQIEWVKSMENAVAKHGLVAVDKAFKAEQTKREKYGEPLIICCALGLVALLVLS